MLFDLLGSKAAIDKGNITSSKELYEAMTGEIESSTGLSVSPDTATRYTAVLACTRVLAESVASLPCVLYRRGPDGGKDRAVDHPLYSVLHDQANDWNTAYDYFEGQMSNLVLRGNGYSYIERDSQGRTINLIPLNPDGIKIEQDQYWRPVYTATMPDNKIRKLKTDEIHHVRGPMPKGYVGQSLISLARNAIGLGMAAEKFGAHLYKNGVKPSGVLKTSHALGPQVAESLRSQFSDKYGGLENSSKPLVLEDGMDWVPLSISPNDAQFLETRKFQRSDIAGIMRVPLHLIGDLERSTNNNIEHQSLEFATYVIRPWLKRIEQSINRDLLSKEERGEYFAEFLMDDLLRGDIESRYTAYSIGRQMKILSTNDVRRKENMNPIEGGDIYENPAIQVDKPVGQE